MSDKRINAIKEIEFRIIKVQKICNEVLRGDSVNIDLFSEFDRVDNLLFDINDFINDLKDTNETN